MALFAFSATAYADDFGYSAVTVSYGLIEFDDADGTSLGIDLSFEVGDSFFVFGGYGMAEIEDSVDTADIDAYNLGIGFHMPLSDKIDLVASASYEYAEVTVPLLGSVDDNGYGLGLGLRFAATEKIEINGSVNYVDFSDRGNDTTLGAGFLYNFTSNFSLGAAGNWNDDSTAYSVSGRFYFGK
jgi:opacity protein-like surface antigen